MFTRASQSGAVTLAAEIEGLSEDKLKEVHVRLSEIDCMLIESSSPQDLEWPLGEHTSI